jgi:hypothetical protein
MWFGGGPPRRCGCPRTMTILADADAACARAGAPAGTRASRCPVVYRARSPRRRPASLRRRRKFVRFVLCAVVELAALTIDTHTGHPFGRAFAATGAHPGAQRSRSRMKTRKPLVSKTGVAGSSPARPVALRKPDRRNVRFRDRRSIRARHLSAGRVRHRTRPRVPCSQSVPVSRWS